MIAVGDSWSDASVLPGTEVFFEYWLLDGFVCWPVLAKNLYDLPDTAFNTEHSVSIHTKTLLDNPF